MPRTLPWREAFRGGKRKLEFCIIAPSIPAGLHRQPVHLAYVVQQWSAFLLNRGLNLFDKFVSWLS